MIPRTTSLFVGLLALAAWPPVATADAKPDIVVIMADDMGYSDIGCYGGEVETPNIDALAAGGIRFTQFYNTGRCCPTRASLLTGLYAHQAGMGWMAAGDLGTYGYRGQINDDCVTIPQVLGPAGYKGYMSGKWHLTWYTKKAFDSPNGSWPTQRGFDRFFGVLRGSVSFWKPQTLTLDDQKITKLPEDFYFTDAITDHAVQFIERHNQDQHDQPMFLYVAHYAPHWPLHARPSDIEKYRGRYLQGWDEVRAARHQRMVEMGLVDSKWGLTPRDDKARAWDSLSDEEKDDFDMRMAVYAAQIECMDRGVGRIIKALKDAGRLENTLILFLSDNGGCDENISSGQDKSTAGLGTRQSYESYRLPWANASNTPFREFKHWVHEGGIAAPLIAHWPKGIADAGALRHTPGHVIDIMPTLVDLGGVEYPQRHGGREIPPMEGVSLVPVFEGKSLDPRALFWEHESNRAVRQGKWKLVAMDKKGPWELYDLEADRTELHNLAESHPRRVEELSALWQAWAETHHVLPLDNRSRAVRLRGQ